MCSIVKIFDIVIQAIMIALILTVFGSAIIIINVLLQTVTFVLKLFYAIFLGIQYLYKCFLKICTL